MPRVLGASVSGPVIVFARTVHAGRLTVYALNRRKPAMHAQTEDGLIHVVHAVSIRHEGDLEWPYHAACLTDLQACLPTDEGATCLQCLVGCTLDDAVVMMGGTPVWTHPP